MCKNKITSLSRNWIRGIVKLSLHGLCSVFRVAHHAQSLSPLKTPHLVVCVTTRIQRFLFCPRTSSALSCCGYCAGGEDEQCLYYLSVFPQEFRLCHNWAVPLNRGWLAVIFLEPVPNSCCSTNRCTLFCRGQCSCIRLSHYFCDLILLYIYFHGISTPSGSGPPHYRGFTITLRRTTFGRTPLDERTARRRNLHLTKHNTNKKQTSMPPVGLKPAIVASERPRTHTLNRAATEIPLFWQTLFSKSYSLWYISYPSITVQMSKKHNLTLSRLTTYIYDVPHS
jgi:hypothetical protein